MKFTKLFTLLLFLFCAPMLLLAQTTCPTGSKIAPGFRTVNPSDGTINRPICVDNATGKYVLQIGDLFLLDGNTFTFEGATANAFELTLTLQDPTVDRTVTFVNASGAAHVGFVTDVLMCGEQANNGTNYMSPVTGFENGQFYADAATLLYNMAGTGCDAQESATEGTADEVMFANNAFKVLGLQCTVSGSGSNGVVLNLRSAVADLAPDVTITIATGDTTGVSSAVTTTDVAAGATFALRVINTEDLSAQDAWCIAKILVVP